jgi:hypothetical protein
MPRPSRGGRSSPPITAEIAPADLGRLMREIKAFDANLAKNMRKRIRDRLTPVKAQVQAAYRAQGTGGGTYEAIAQSVQIKVAAGKNAGVSLGVNTRKLTPRQRAVARGTEKGTWRHPVFGNRERWVSQTANPVFGPIVAQELPAIQREVLAAIQDTVNDMNRGISG